MRQVIYAYFYIFIYIFIEFLKYFKAIYSGELNQYMKANKICESEHIE